MTKPESTPAKTKTEAALQVTEKTLTARKGRRRAKRKLRALRRAPKGKMVDHV